MWEMAWMTLTPDVPHFLFVIAVFLLRNPKMTSGNYFLPEKNTAFTWGALICLNFNSSSRLWPFFLTLNNPN